MADRRTFLKAGALGAAGTLPLGWDAIAQQAAAPSANAPTASDQTVKLTGDGVALSPTEYARLVVRLVDEKNLVPDSYSIGGVVEELETAFARVLKKERAVRRRCSTISSIRGECSAAGSPRHGRSRWSPCITSTDSARVTVQLSGRRRRSSR